MKDDHDEMICPTCGAPICPNNVCEYNGDWWCGDCVDDNSFISHYSGQRFCIDVECQVVVLRDQDGIDVTQPWAKTEVEDYATYCNRTRKYYRSDAFTFIKLPSGATHVQFDSTTGQGTTSLVEETRAT